MWLFHLLLSIYYTLRCLRVANGRQTRPIKGQPVNILHSLLLLLDWTRLLLTLSKLDQNSEWLRLTSVVLARPALVAAVPPSRVRERERRECMSRPGAGRSWIKPPAPSRRPVPPYAPPPPHPTPPGRVIIIILNPGESGRMRTKRQRREEKGGLVCVGEEQSGLRRLIALVWTVGRRLRFDLLLILTWQPRKLESSTCRN